jgi:1,4-dihydroxy-2-naphthoate octaprenyltransferase
MRDTDPRVAALPAEPSLERLRSPALRLLLATRPQFLTITLVGAVLGIAVATAGGNALSPWTAAATIFLALAVHAGVNVLNDWCDHLNGTDAANVDRIYPFTGGSRFIQNGVLSPDAMRNFAFALFGIAVVGGLTLAAVVGPGLIAYGLAGVLVGWAYSARPLALNSRGLGEACIVVTFGLVVGGADFVQRGAFSWTPLLAGAAYALMTTNILYINQFPDRAADIAAGKLHWVARLPVAQARWGYGVILLAAAASIVLPVLGDALPLGALLALLGLAPALHAFRVLLRNAATPPALAPAIQATIVSAHLVGVLMAVGFWLPRFIG